MEKKKQKRYLKFTDSQGEKTLEKEHNINLTTVESTFFVDPLFKIMT